MSHYVLPAAMGWLGLIAAASVVLYLVDRQQKRKQRDAERRMPLAVVLEFPQHRAARARSAARSGRNTAA